MELKIALRVDDLDNVATVFANGVVSGDTLELRDKKGNSEAVTVIGDVPYGHKIAATDIPQDAKIIKYGEVIGAAICPIAKGEYVHVHNLVALRGRGDL